MVVRAPTEPYAREKPADTSKITDVKWGTNSPRPPNVLRGTRLRHLAKNEQARREPAEEGISVAQD
jgi:hypothetical protein